MRHILHADFDAFYASVEQLDRPRLRGKPVVVGGRPEGRGVVASASYEARRFGVRSAMPMRAALRLCPQAIRVDPRFSRYQEVSRRVMAIFRDITPIVEPLSLDEAFLDVSEVVTPMSRPVLADASAHRGAAADIARELKRRVKEELGLTISVGIATNKSVAKIASALNKPDGLTIVAPGSEREFLAPLDVDTLWGVGPKTAARLKGEGIHTIRDMAAQSEEWFRARFGKSGPHMRLLSQGQDDRPVVVERETKSVSAETTLDRDTSDADALLELVNRLSQRVARHLSQKELQGRTVKLKLRLADFTTFTRQATLSAPVQSSEQLASAAGALLQPELKPGRLFRLIGVGVSGFDETPRHEEAHQLRLAGFE